MFQKYNPKIQYRLLDEKLLKVDQFYIDKAKFIYESSKEYLNNISENTDKLQQKIYPILAFIFSFMSLAFFKALNMLYTFQFLSTQIYVLKICLLLFSIIIEYALISLYLIFCGIIPKNKHISGNEPTKLISQENIDRPLTLLLIDEASTYHEKIFVNFKTNKKIATCITFSIIAIFFAPIITALFLFYI